MAEIVRVLRSKPFQGWCVLLVCALLLGHSMAHGAARGYDFRAFYAAGHIARTSISHMFDVKLQNSVEDQLVGPAVGFKPFYHPSFEALLFIPFSLLPYGVAYQLFIVVNAVLLWVAYRTGPRHAVFPLARRSRAFAYFTFLPVFLTLLVGQDCILFLVLCCLSFRMLEHRDEWSAGFFLGLGIFRPQLALPIGLLLSIRYGRRFATSFAAVSAVLAGFSAFLVRKEGIVALTSLISTISLVNNHGAEVQASMSVYPQRMPNLYGLVYICGARYLAPRAAFLVTALASAIVFVCCVYIIRHAKTPALSFAIAVLGATLLSFHLFSYDMTILLLPLMILSGGLHPYLVVVCYALPCLLFFWGIPDWFALMAPVPIALLANAGAHVLRNRRSAAIEQLELATEYRA